MRAMLFQLSCVYADMEFACVTVGDIQVNKEITVFVSFPISRTNYRM